MYSSKYTGCTTSRVTSGVNHELWVTMMCPCAFISCSRCSTLVGDVGAGGGEEVLSGGQVGPNGNSLYLLPNVAVNLNLL